VQWEQLAPLLPPQRPRTGRPAGDHRIVLSGILWVLRTGAPWRDLPEYFGSWSTAYSRFRRWTQAGVWQRVLVMKILLAVAGFGFVIAFTIVLLLVRAVQEARVSEAVRRPEEEFGARGEHPHWAEAEDQHSGDEGSRIGLMQRRPTGRRTMRTAQPGNTTPPQKRKTGLAGEVETPRIVRETCDAADGEVQRHAEQGGRATATAEALGQLQRRARRLGRPLRGCSEDGGGPGLERRNNRRGARSCFPNREFGVAC
jgi:hypothetical protein